MEALTLILALLRVPSQAGADLTRFPRWEDCETCKAVCEAYVDALEKEQKYSLSPRQWRRLEELLTDARRRRTSWATLGQAHTMERRVIAWESDTTVEALNRLRWLLGDERWYWGTMPSPTPGW